MFALPPAHAPPWFQLKLRHWDHGNFIVGTMSIYVLDRDIFII